MKDALGERILGYPSDVASALRGLWGQPGHDKDMRKLHIIIVAIIFVDTKDSNKRGTNKTPILSAGYGLARDAYPGRADARASLPRDPRPTRGKADSVPRLRVGLSDESHVDFLLTNRTETRV